MEDKFKVLEQVKQIFENAAKRRETNLWRKGDQTVKYIGPVYNLGISDERLGHFVEDIQTGEQKTLTEEEFSMYKQVKQ